VNGLSLSGFDWLRQASTSSASSLSQRAGLFYPEGMFVRFFEIASRKIGWKLARPVSDLRQQS
jgi:hypothetical protein